MLRFVLLLTFFTATLPAAQPVLAQPESVGMSSERLKRIGVWLDGIIERKEAAGFVTIIARRGQVVHYESRGTRGLSVSGPMPLEALFDIASMTKPITVAAALTLLEEGKFTLADPISEFLPAFKDSKVQLDGEPLKPADREITVRHLFTHTSGVSDPRSRAETFAFPTLEAYMADFAKLPLRAQPGSEWLYGDSHDVLGYLVQEVSGRPLDEFVKERILEPLGMSDTHYWPPKSKDSRRAILVVDGKDNLDSTSRRPIAAAEAGTFIGGASGIYTTAADYWRFCQMLLNGGTFGGRRLLGPKTVSWINQDHLGSDVTFRPGQRFGLGFAILTDPGKADWFYSRGSYFWGGSQGTVFWIDPAEELTAVLMVQVTPNSPLQLREKLAALVYSAIID